MTDPAPTSRAAQPGRDAMLDLWRGLALVDMACVHLANHPIGMPPLAAAWIGDHTRFAAGALVLLSGMTVGHVFGPALRSRGSRGRRAFLRLFRRALLLVVVGRLASLAYLGIDSAMRGFPAAGERLGVDLLGLATFSTPGVTGGLLLLYSLLLLAVPLLERFRSVFGGAATAAASLAVFALAQHTGPVAHWPPWVFPLPHWQPLFVAGYLAAPHAARLRERDAPGLRRWRIAVTFAFALVFVFRMASMAGMEPAGFALPEFRKVPLSTMELAWYLVATGMALTWSAWLHDRNPFARTLSRWMQGLGSWSLLAYVAHLLLEPPVLMFVEVTHASAGMRAAMLPVMLAAMYAVVVVAERLDADLRRRNRRETGGVRLRDRVPTAGWVGSGVGAAAFAAVLAMRGALPPESASPQDSTQARPGIEGLAIAEPDGMLSHDEIDARGAFSSRGSVEEEAPPLIDAELAIRDAAEAAPFGELRPDPGPADPDPLLLEQ